MEAVKSEPEVKPDLLMEVSAECAGDNMKSQGKPDSRPPLKEKTMNRQQLRCQKSEVIEDAKRKSIAQFFQSTELNNNGFSGRPPNGDKRKPSIKAEHPAPLVVSKRAIGDAKTGNGFDGKEKMNQNGSAAVSVSPIAKKLKVDQHQSSPVRTDLPSAAGEDKHAIDIAVNEPPPSAQCLPTNPGPYAPVKAGLYEQSSKGEDKKYYEDVFHEVQDQEEKHSCIAFAEMNLNTWIKAGEELQLEHKRILARLIKARMGLSEKFRVITDLINKRASALNAQGQILDLKLRRIQDLGKEILDII
ncbi:LADA_0G08306g1_1 [Lachancea dasiensis]|uniref:LADA_0G08306g1_1 n=1 Tax=Lachancea dasiensis TaxID=1072105 RepID=A0A1G4JU04_9SACH|nr:LADA_0G08306g1_1 [Lachancea dasiensis]